MNALVGYGSSDEEEDEFQSQRAAKIARTDAYQSDIPTNTTSESSAPLPKAYSGAPPTVSAEAAPPPQSEDDPAPGPSMIPQRVDPTSSVPASAPQSPYTAEVQRIHELTMPTVPNFDIPDSPPPPPRNSEEAATLAATTKKFQRFLELKRQGVHFHDRLQKSAALRNPSLMSKLMQFAGISEDESYMSSLSPDVAVATKWPRECYVEELVRVNDWKEKKRKEGREKVDFVHASSAATSGRSSASGTPKQSSAVQARGPKRSKFDG